MYMLDVTSTPLLHFDIASSAHKSIVKENTKQI